MGMNAYTPHAAKEKENESVKEENAWYWTPAFRFISLKGNNRH